MVYKCKVSDDNGVHVYLRGTEESVYDHVDHFFMDNEDREPMIVDHVDRTDDEVFVHLMANSSEVYCDTCDIVLNSEKQYMHHVRGRRHQCSIL